MDLLDKGRTWNAPAAVERGPVESIWVDSKDRARRWRHWVAERAARAAHVNAGQFWDDLTAELPEGPAHGVAADRPTGTVYVATDRGVFFTTRT